MAQEFVIKSTTLEDKINSLLPSQGGAQAGVDLSASSMIVPVVNLTEAAEGSVLRQDLQSSFGHGGTTPFFVSNTTTTLINTTGYFRIKGSMSTLFGNDTATCTLSITDGTTAKILVNGKVMNIGTGSNVQDALQFDFLVFLAAGDSITATTSAAVLVVNGISRQIADISGNLVNPT